MTVEVIKAYLATEIEGCGEYEERKTNITEKEIIINILGALKEGE